MATTNFIVNLHLEFDVKADRNTVYTALKGTLATLKGTTPWIAGQIYKDEHVIPEVAQESV